MELQSAIVQHSIPVSSRLIATGLLACAFLLPGPLTGQNKRGPWKLAAIKAIGSQRYAPAEIATATGLQIGQIVAEEDFQKVSQRLGQLGAFDSVSYTYQYSGDGVKVEFQVHDSGQFVPVRFENFVWFSDAVLRARLHQQVPLFDGMLPLSGELVDEVSDALQVMLVERKVPGRADYIRAGPEGGAVNAIVFSVTGPDIRIRSVQFAGAPPAELAILSKLGRQLQERPYSQTLLQVQAEKNFLPFFLARGYLKAAIADNQAKVVDTNDQETGVDVTFTVKPGPQYKLSGIEWSGNKVFPVAALQALVHAQSGQPANPVLLDEDLQQVKNLYGTRGYVTATIKASQQIDDANSTVSYTLEVHEGSVFHMGEIQMQGLDDHDARVVLARWHLDKGAVYDSSYPRHFLDDIFSSAVLDRNWASSIHEAVNEDDKTVDVTLSFVRKAIE